MARKLYEIWDEPDTGHFHWKAQLHDYVGNFPCREAAERFVAAVQKERARAKPDGKPDGKKGKK